MACISVENVTFYHGKGTPYEIKALDNVSLTIEPDAVTGIIGHTGSGKSTLVEMFNGILRPHEGTVRIDGEELPVGVGDVVRIPPDAMHTVVNRENAELLWAALWWPVME